MSVENKKKVKALCQSVLADIQHQSFLVETPNYLDINYYFFGCIFCFFHCWLAKNTTLTLPFSPTVSKNNYKLVPLVPAV